MKDRASEEDMVVYSDKQIAYKNPCSGQRGRLCPGAGARAQGGRGPRTKRARSGTHADATRALSDRSTEAQARRQLWPVAGKARRQFRAAGASPHPGVSPPDEAVPRRVRSLR